MKKFSSLHKRHRSRSAALALCCGAVLSLAMRWGGGSGDRVAESVSPATGVVHWREQAENLGAAGNWEAAVEACRAGLHVEPWNPDLCLLMTRLHLERGDRDLLAAWMDELVIGDARQAETHFALAEFGPWRRDALLQRLHEEAKHQALD